MERPLSFAALPDDLRAAAGIFRGRQTGGAGAVKGCQGPDEPAIQRKQAEADRRDKQAERTVSVRSAFIALRAVPRKEQKQGLTDRTAGFGIVGLVFFPFEQKRRMGDDEYGTRIMDQRADHWIQDAGHCQKNSQKFRAMEKTRLILMVVIIRLDSVKRWGALSSRHPPGQYPRRL